MRMPSSDKMDLYKDIVATIQLLLYLFQRGISTGVFERLKFDRRKIGEKPSQRQN
jgi:hypothetical protein